MTKIAKIALIGSEVNLALDALHDLFRFYSREETYDYDKRKRVQQIINKIKKAEKKDA